MLLERLRKENPSIYLLYKMREVSHPPTWDINYPETTADSVCWKDTPEGQEYWQSINDGEVPKRILPLKDLKGWYIRITKDNRGLVRKRFFTERRYGLQLMIDGFYGIKHNGFTIICNLKDFNSGELDEFTEITTDEFLLMTTSSQLKTINDPVEYVHYPNEIMKYKDSSGSMIAEGDVIRVSSTESYRFDILHIGDEENEELLLLVK